MKQVVQQPKAGAVVEEVPAPALRGEGVLVRNHASLISAGTERAAVSVGSKSLLTTARERPDLVRRVLKMVSTQGWRATLQKVRARMGTSTPLGYSCSGEVLAASPGLGEFSVGERVACAGASYANHAEVVFIPKNLCVRIPDGVSYEDAAYVTVGAIAMQGIRQADVRIGESVAVIGLGLLGQLTVQILKASGVRVAGVDLDEEKVKLAHEHGADLALSRTDGVEDKIKHFTGGRGVDASILTASTTSNDPIELAGEITREKGRVIVVGALGLNVPRQPYYMKELDMRLSRSYGPGRYDPEYEEKGSDYPYGYVRWTERRNMEHFLHLVAEGAVRLQRITTHRFPIEEAQKAYALLTGESKESYLGLVLTYDAKKPLETKVTFPVRRVAPAAPVRMSVFGAGSFAQGVLLPKLSELGTVQFRGLVTAESLPAKRVVSEYGFAFAGNDANDVWGDKETNAVLIATRHNLHAPLAQEALRRGKHVFVEKPLALNDEELQAMVETYAHASAILSVGFNRRFAPATQKIRDHFSGRAEPLFIHYRVNAGFIPKEHWVHDPVEGGGRIVGEACHFVNWILYLTGSDARSVYAESLKSTDPGAVNEDSVAVTLSLSDGSVGTIHYLACGPEAVAKEQVEVFGEGRYAHLDDYRAVTLGYKNRTDTTRFSVQDKGHGEELRCFADAIAQGGESPVPFDEAVHTTEVTFRILDSLRIGEKIVLGKPAA
jgi:polar amino acid transport system substrate-binding protein